MKKSLLLVGVLAVSLAFAGCGKKEDTTSGSTEATTEAAKETGEAEQTVAEGNGELVEEAYFEGKVTELADGKITVVDLDGNAKTFTGLDQAEIYAEGSALMQGCYVEIAFQEGDTAAEPKAIRVTVLMTNEEQAAEEGQDPYIYGKVKVMDENDLYIDDVNGVERVFDNSISRSVSFNGISVGSDVVVTYIGTLDKESQVDTEDGTGAGTPIAVKIVAVDALTSEDAKKNEITGTVDTVEGGKLYLDTLPMSFEFSGDPSVFEGLEGEETVTVTYEGSLGNLAAEAKSVVVK
ncbi:MAG: hypothetical protein Q4B86_01465 [Eubacteriales bacterium]|nr:hypothetical protein [Eubacteriales bacterium]